MSYRASWIADSAAGKTLCVAQASPDTRNISCVDCRELLTTTYVWGDCHADRNSLIDHEVLDPVLIVEDVRGSSKVIATSWGLAAME